MDQNGGGGFGLPGYNFPREQQPRNVWDSLAVGEQIGMPGHSQQGQLLDDPSGTDSDEDLRPAAKVPQPLAASMGAQIFPARHPGGMPASGGVASIGSMPAASSMVPIGSLGGSLAPFRQEQAAPRLVPAPQVDQQASPAAPSFARKDESGTDTDEDGELIRAKAKAVQEKVKAAVKRRAPGKTRQGAGITLGLLINEGIIEPGENVLSVEYKSVMTQATLTADGQIICRINGTDATFESPSAFSIFLKRLVNPQRKADDGWKTVKYKGRFLEAYKLELARRRVSALGEDGGEAAQDSGASPAKKARLDDSVGEKKPPKPRAPKAKANGNAGGSLKVMIKRPAKEGSNLEDESQLVTCRQYSGEPGSGQPGTQPFQVVYSPAVALLMDIHTHLSRNEVIGLLGGSWNPEQRLLKVERAFPVQEVQSEADTPGAAMDPKDEARVRESMQSQHHLRCVGWYHSHPTFSTQPSRSDIATQLRYQRQHRPEGSTAEPFIAAIVGPYGSRLESELTEVRWLHVDFPRDQALPAGDDVLTAGAMPVQLQVVEEGDAATEDYMTGLPRGAMTGLAHRCATSPWRTDMLGSWRNGKSNLDKLKTCIANYLPSHWSDKKVEDYLLKVDAVVAAAWKVFAKPVQPKVQEEPEVEISDVTEEDPVVAATTLADDAASGHPPQAEAGNPGEAVRQGYAASPQPQGYFDQGYGDGFGDGYALGGQMQYRGNFNDYNEDDDISE